MCDFSRVSAWFCDEKISLKKVVSTFTSGGDMSLVGTRPPTLDEWEKYEPHHRARMSFRPGLTGLWQVSGRSNITDFEEVVKLDTKYIGEWSVKGDHYYYGKEKCTGEKTAEYEVVPATYTLDEERGSSA